MGEISEQQARLISAYQNERSVIQADIERHKVETLLINTAVSFAHRIKGNDCMYTRDCFQEYLKALAQTIAQSGQDMAYLLPVVQKIKNRVFGC